MPDIRGASLSSSEESNQAKEDLNGLLWTANKYFISGFLSAMAAKY